ncbi:MAG TPA: methyl-accepting chemotaxis protein [Desulfobacteria bacterium]|nr:methyl-accepting chemotaxis protein [Desulfobacteria bacterium]
MKLGIEAKLLATVSLILVILLVFVSVFAINTVVNTSLTEKAKSDLASAIRLVDSLYPGEWNVKGGSLYKGNTKINGNTRIVDTIGKITKDTSTIFLGDTRIATNVVRNGKRAVGTKAAANVVDTVLKGGQEYSGEADVVGVQYQTAYSPIKDKTGAVIGMFYVGASKSLSDELKSNLIKQLITLGIVLFVITLVGTWLLARKMIKPIRNMVKYSRQIAEGNLAAENIKITSRDELGQLGTSLNEMANNLRSLIHEVSESAQLVAASANELSTGVEQHGQATTQVATSISEVADGAKHQSIAIDGTLAVIEQMSNGMQDIAKHSSSVESLAVQAALASENGKSAVDKTITQMDSVDKSTGNVNATITKLAEGSQQINAIINVISDIAAQTNLLALNAAIEAARAGEQGRGFAVVADEVRKLAEQSQRAATQITELISENNLNIDNVVTAMDTGAQDVKIGIAVVHDAGKAFGEIADLIKQVSDRIQEISASVKQMAEGSHQVAESVRKIETVGKAAEDQAQTVSAATEEQSASIQEIASASENLSSMAQTLQSSVSRFKL